MTKLEEVKKEVLEAIQTIYDPEIPVDIYELRLIYEYNVFEVKPDSNEFNVHILMTLTSPSCPSAEQIPSDVEQAIRIIKEVNDVYVELSFEPPYTMEMMSEAAKLELGFM